MAYTPVSLPAYAVVRENIKDLIQEVATAEAAVASWRGFTVCKDRTRPWLEKEQKAVKALVNIITDSKEAIGNARYKKDEVTFFIDLYAFGRAKNVTVEGVTSLLPADEAAAARLDLLVEQVEFALTRMKNHDLGITAGMISRNISSTLQFWSQEAEDSTGQYAPARFTIRVNLAYTVADDGTTAAISKLTTTTTLAEGLESWKQDFTYIP